MSAEVFKDLLYGDFGSKIVPREVYYYGDVTQEVRLVVLGTFRSRGNFGHANILINSFRLSFYRKSFDRYLVTERVLNEFSF